ncbi:MAG: hypothetical protein PVSMB7_06050 [Chloroflexota bacterium]
MRRVRVVFTIVILCFAGAAHQSRPDGAFASRPAPVPVFTSVLSRLSAARIPVYLPSWLPPFTTHAYAFAGLTDGGRGYFAYLSSVRSGGGDASYLFTLDAHPGGPDTVGRTVVLRDGRVAHVDPHTGGNRGPTISWGAGGYSYEIGYLSPDALLVHAARSMVRVQTSPAPLNASPVAAVKLLIPFRDPKHPGPCYSGKLLYRTFGARGCPVTTRLRDRLQSNPTSGPGGGADPVCRCQSPPLTTTYHLDSNSDGVALVTAWFSYDHRHIGITFVVLHRADGWRVDDIYCANRPVGSIYHSPVGPCV